MGELHPEASAAGQCDWLTIKMFQQLVIKMRKKPLYLLQEKSYLTKLSNESKFQSFELYVFFEAGLKN